jgi:hypothetical protein
MEALMFLPASGSADWISRPGGEILMGTPGCGGGEH